MTDALLLVDVINDFRHEDGAKLLASFRERHDALVRALDEAREHAVPVVYANDNFGVWDGDARRLVEEAKQGEAGTLVARIAPEEGDRFVVKPRYSAFDHTPLVLILRELEVERILLAGAATEMCVVQTAIDAKEEASGSPSSRTPARPPIRRSSGWRFATRPRSSGRASTARLDLPGIRYGTGADGNRNRSGHRRRPRRLGSLRPSARARSGAARRGRRAHPPLHPR
jgi:hypothetical protein